jgi:hypothetical protein
MIVMRSSATTSEVPWSLREIDDGRLNERLGFGITADYSQPSSKGNAERRNFKSLTHQILRCMK